LIVPAWYHMHCGLDLASTSVHDEGVTKLTGVFLMRIFFIEVLFLITSNALFAKGNARSSTPKIPHSHHSQMGGHVLMFGDDHMELALDENKQSIVLVSLSDKLRDPLAAVSLDLEFILINSAEATAPQQVLSPKLNDRDPSKIFLELPTNISPDSQLQIKMTRKTPVKGVVSTKKSQKISLKKLKKTGK